MISTPKPKQKNSIAVIAVFTILALVLAALAAYNPPTLAILLSASVALVALCGCIRNNWLICLASAPLFFLVAYLVSPSITVAVFVAAAAIPAVLLSRSVIKNEGKAQAVVTVAITAFIAVAALIAVYVNASMGSVTVENIKAVYDGAFDSLGKYANETYAEIAELYRSYGMTEINGIDVTEFFSAYASEMTEYIKTLAFALIVVAVLVFGYLAASLFKLFAKISGYELLLPDPVYELRLSLVSSVVYLVCASVAFIFSGTSLFILTLRNLAIILIPGTFVMGMNAIIRLTKRKNMRIKPVFVVIIILILLLFMTGFGILLISMIGAWSVIAAAIVKRITDKKNNGEE